MNKPTYEELQAKVERLRNAANKLSFGLVHDDTPEWIPSQSTDKAFSNLQDILKETPADSLAALKAQWQAEACQYEDGMPAQKAFWEGFERGVAGCNNLNIREHWREYVGFKTGAKK